MTIIELSQVYGAIGQFVYLWKKIIEPAIKDRNISPAIAMISTSSQEFIALEEANAFHNIPERAHILYRTALTHLEGLALTREEQEPARQKLEEKIRQSASVQISQLDMLLQGNPDYDATRRRVD